MVGKDLDAKERKSCQNADALNPLITGHYFHSKIDFCQTANSYIEQERIPCHKSEAKSIEPVADDFAESDPSRVSPAIARDSAVLNDVPSTNCFDSLQTDEAEICIPVDYVVYQKKCSAGCTVSFSHDCIKISGLTTPEEDQEIHSLEKGIDDIVLIQSERLERFESVSVKLHVLSKDAGQVHGTSGLGCVEELEFVVCDPDWFGRWQQITSLNEKYMSLWRAVHEYVLSNLYNDAYTYSWKLCSFERAFEDVIYPEGDCDAVSINKRDVALLEPETFINDTIIDFYIQYLKNQIPSEEKHKFHFFNSFFFRKLADLDKDPSSALDGRAAFLRVLKWTRKVDLFGKDYVFIPVNFGLHWSLLVICHPGEVASFKEEDVEKSLRVPCILHMDSIKGTHAGLKNLVQSYLWEEFKQRHKDASEDVSSKFMNLRFVPLELPQQENSFDCGLFLLHYLELFLSEAPVNFNLFSINKFSKFLSGDWFHPAEASLKRTLIQKLIAELLENRDKEGISSGGVGGKAQTIFPDDGKESGVEFVARNFPPTVGGHGNSSSFPGGQGIEMTILETSSSVRNSECIVGDPNLVLRELFQPEVAAAGSLHAQCSSFEPSSSYYHLNEDVEPMEVFPFPSIAVRLIQTMSLWISRPGKKLFSLTLSHTKDLLLVIPPGNPELP
ncbi:unnamed protein product [Linum tenue]|uniref:Ubiquitin-like protease family profile domain-containing protein n=1 Tax=Linum tenue TaxID=586396 RepID=A0AAV0J7Z9_9ROSI|nr:unnamed protein product [Linum tenue]